MIRFAGVNLKKSSKILDVGCGIGGSSRLLAKLSDGETQITGITLSPNQVEYARKLTYAQGLENKCHFEVMDAMNLRFPDKTFDFLWICESTEHMHDKEKAIKEFSRVTKPGGKIVIAVWSQRDDSEIPFTDREKKQLQYLYDHWSHPPFLSIKKMMELLKENGFEVDLRAEDWTKETLPSWYHQIYLGIIDPLPWLKRPTLYLKNMKDAWCLHRMSQAFQSGLMQYGLITATKKLS